MKTPNDQDLHFLIVVRQYLLASLATPWPNTG